MTPATIAIMQPYFIPYAGYFRLFAVSDLFVIYDCVQFPRRGWVHRNRLPDRTGVARWLTLPLAKAPQSALIKDLRFPRDAAGLLDQRLRSFALGPRHSTKAAPFLDQLRQVEGNPVDYLERLLRDIVAYLGLPGRTMRSSALNLPPSLRGQERIIEIARRLGARRYVNSPGGRALYDGASFAAAGLELRFLPEYRGNSISILPRLLQEKREDLADEICSTANISLQP